MQLFYPSCRTSDFLLKPYFRFLTEPPYWRFLLAQFLCLIKIALVYSSALRHVSNSALTYHKTAEGALCVMIYVIDEDIQLTPGVS